MQAELASAEAVGEVRGLATATMRKEEEDDEEEEVREEGGGQRGRQAGRQVVTYRPTCMCVARYLAMTRIHSDGSRMKAKGDM